jgi:hypothetical protein
MLVAAATFVGGCDDGPLGTCQWHVPGVCVEENGDKDAARDACTQLNGEFEEGKVCPSEERLGGCRTTYDRFEETIWFYPGNEAHQTEADIRAYCSGAGGEYVPPG